MFLFSSRPSRPLPWLKHPTTPSTPRSAYQPRPLLGAQGTELTAGSTFLHCSVLCGAQGTLGPVPRTVPTSKLCPPLPPQRRPKSGSHSQIYFSHSSLAVSPFLLPPLCLRGHHPLSQPPPQSQPPPALAWGDTLVTPPVSWPLLFPLQSLLHASAGRRFLFVFFTPPRSKHQTTKRCSKVSICF